MSTKPVMRGYFGIGVYSPKTSHNVGSLWRSCLEFDASFMFTVGSRCGMDGQPSNTVKAERHVPLYVVPSWEQLILPTGCRLVGVEQCDRSVPLEDFDHPEQAVYLLGAEDDGLPEKVWDYCTGGIVHISTQRCLNVAVAGSIIMYDRTLSLKAQQRRELRAGRKIDALKEEMAVKLEISREAHRLEHFPHEPDGNRHSCIQWSR